MSSAAEIVTGLVTEPVTRETALAVPTGGRAIVAELKRKALLREVNTRIREISDRFGAGEGSYRLLCECGHEDCAERLDVPTGEYDDLRRSGGFLFATGHEPAGSASPQAARIPAFVPADPLPLQ